MKIRLYIRNPELPSAKHHRCKVYSWDEKGKLIIKHYYPVFFGLMMFHICRRGTKQEVYEMEQLPYMLGSKSKKSGGLKKRR